MATDVGTGTTITLTGVDAQLLADITSIEWSGWSAEAVETTNMGTTAARTFISGDLYDPGEITIEGHFDSTQDIPTWGTAGTITIAFAGVGTTDLWTVSGFLTEFSISDPLEDVMTFSATMKATGAVSKA